MSPLLQRERHGNVLKIQSVSLFDADSPAESAGHTQAETSWTLFSGSFPPFPDSQSAVTFNEKR